MKVGKPKFGGDFVKRKYWKLKDGESVFRILPPLGEKACETGRWSQFYNVHYGYKNTKGQMRVFQSPLVKNRKTRMVEVADTALERIEKLKTQEAAAKAAGNTEVAKKLGELLQQYNLDNNHYVNAIDQQGNIGILKLRHRAKLALDATIAKLRAQTPKIEPLDADSGRFFVFSRSGTGLETTFQVSVLQAKRDIEGVGTVYQDVVHTLSEEILGRLEKEAAELDKLYKRPTSEEVARIVATSDLLTGKSSAVDELFDTKPDAATNSDGAEEEYNGTDQAPTANGNGVAKAAQTPPLTTVLNSTGASLGASLVAATTAPTAGITAKVQQQTLTPAPTVPKTTAQLVNDQSDEDFLKSLGL